MSDDETIGQKINRYRMELGLSVQELAAKASTHARPITAEDIERWEERTVPRWAERPLSAAITKICQERGIEVEGLERGVPAKDPRLAEIGGRVSITRKKRGISQATLAQMIEKEQRFVSNIETGTSDFTVLTALNICAALGIKPSYLFGEVTQEQSDETGFIEEYRSRTGKERSLARSVSFAVWNNL